MVEGADGSGRSTQIAQLVHWLEGSGHATAQVGLKRSTLVSEELELAKQGNILSRTTMSLFYATDFADQLENSILPALRAGFMVLADRYIYTLMARDIVARHGGRLAEETCMASRWCRTLSFISAFRPEQLVQRNFAKNGLAGLLGKRNGSGAFARPV